MARGLKIIFINWKLTQKHEEERYSDFIGRRRARYP
jgi:hypothetical protein